MPTSATCRKENSAGARCPSGPPAAALESRSGSRCGPAASRHPSPDSLRGFTLLELVVVLALLGLIAALAFPNLERLYAGVVRNTERDYILDQFTGLGRRAMQQARTLVVVGSGGARADDPAGTGADRPSRGSAAGPASGSVHEPHVIDVPGGWAISFDEPLVVRPNGVCLGAELTLRHRGAVEARIRLDPPYCRIDADG